MNKATIFRVLLAFLMTGGIAFAQVDSLIYEVVQTNPPLGTPPTASAGFCSSNGGTLGCTNVQRYVRIDPNVGSGTIDGVWLSAGDDVAPLLRQFGIDSIYATFAGSGYTVVVIDINNTQSVLAGNFISTPSGVGNIQNIVLNQLVPTALTSEGIYEVKNFATGIGNNPNQPLRFELAQNYPNPFNPSTVIRYQLPNSANVTLKVFDVTGKEVAEVVNGYQTAGEHSVEFNAANLPSGIYFYRLSAGNYTATRKMMLVR
jgi:hypothetical protein